jgi:hypothetical protein
MARRKRIGIKRARLSIVEGIALYLAVADLGVGETAHALERFGIDYCCMPQPRHQFLRATKQLHFYATGSAIAAMRKAGRKVEVIADAQKEAAKMQKRIPKDDRFKGGKTGPEGVGKLI